MRGQFCWYPIVSCWITNLGLDWFRQLDTYHVLIFGIIWKPVDWASFVGAECLPTNPLAFLLSRVLNTTNLEAPMRQHGSCLLLAFRVLFAPQGQIGCLCDFWTLLRAVYQIFPLFLSMTAGEPIGASISFNCLICSTGVSLARRPCLMMICAIVPFEWNGAWLTSHLDVHNSEMERRTILLGDPLLQSAWLWLSWCVIHWKMEHKLLDKILVWYSLGWM